MNCKCKVQILIFLFFICKEITNLQVNGNNQDFKILKKIFSDPQKELAKKSPLEKKCIQIILLLLENYFESDGESSFSGDGESSQNIQVTKTPSTPLKLIDNPVKIKLCVGIHKDNITLCHTPKIIGDSGYKGEVVRTNKSVVIKD